MLSYNKARLFHQRPFGHHASRHSEESTAEPIHGESVEEAIEKLQGWLPPIYDYRFIAFGAKAVEQPDAHRHQQHEGCLRSGFVSGAAPGQHSPTLGTKQG